MVSNLGRVKCLDWHKRGVEKMMSFCDSNKGYWLVRIDLRLVLVHRLVCEAFHTNPQNKPCVDHIDTNTHNNCVWNLRWVTRKENANNPLTIEHSRQNGSCLGKFGAEHPNSIPIVQLTLDGKFIKKWSCGYEARRELGIAQQNIHHCCKGRRKNAGGFRWMYYSDWVKKTKKSVKEIAPLF